MATTPGPLVHVLLIREDGGVTAQLLEMDFAARGATDDDALRCLARNVTGQARLDQMYGRPPFADCRPAPTQFWDMWRVLDLAAGHVSSVPSAHVINASLLSSSYQLHW